MPSCGRDYPLWAHCSRWHARLLSTPHGAGGARRADASHGRRERPAGAVIAAAFAVLLSAVSELRTLERRARASEEVLVVANRLERLSSTSRRASAGSSSLAKTGS